MNLQNDERSYFDLYQSFGETVRHLLERSVAIAGNPDLRRRILASFQRKRMSACMGSVLESRRSLSGPRSEGISSELV